MTEDDTRQQSDSAVLQGQEGSRNFGDYRILRSLGSGSLGETFLAEHRFLKQPVVLKILHEDIASAPGFIQRFETEVRLLGQLNHPNVVRVHNVSQADGRYFLVTDAVVDTEGATTSLVQFFDAHQQRLTEDVISQILQQVAAAVDHAHTTQLGNHPAVHGALKPSNVHVSVEGNGLKVSVGDFGLAGMASSLHILARTLSVVLRTLSEGSTDASPEVLAWHDSFQQTFAFLAPEQKDVARFNAIGVATDRYAFGVLAYWLLAGRVPEGCFPLPSTLRDDLVGNWDALVQLCMHPEPTQRPKTLTDAMAELNQVAPTPTPQRQARHADGSPQPLIRSRHLERPEEDLHPEKAFQVDHTVKVYQPESKELPEIAPLETEMIIIEGGTFSRGSTDGKRDELPRHKITLRSFAVDVHPVTNEQFVRFLEAMGGEKDNFHRDLIRLRESRIKRSGGKVSIESGYHKHPVVGVTWYGASAYAKWVGKRLPTEAEWEVAASGGDHGWAFPTGDAIDKSQANYFSADTTPIKAYPENELGLYDVAGNVYEWCLDWYDYNYYERSVQEPDNPQGPRQGVYRVLRGGCWKSLKEDLRCSRRHRNNPGTVNGTYGFRCAADVQ